VIEDAKPQSGDVLYIIGADGSQLQLSPKKAE